MREDTKSLLPERKIFYMRKLKEFRKGLRILLSFILISSFIPQKAYSDENLRVPISNMRLQTAIRAFLLDKVRYVEDDTNFIPERIKYIFSSIHIQNNRKAGPCRACSGGCPYCYSETLGMINAPRNPIEIDALKAIVDKAIKLGFYDITIAGEDTLDDLDTFYALLDIFSDNQKSFTFFTNGSSLLKDIELSKTVFERYASKVRKYTVNRIVFSWDMDKVNRWKNWPQFGGNEEKVLEAMADVLHIALESFEKAEGAIDLSISATDFDTGSMQESIINCRT